MDNKKRKALRITALVVMGLYILPLLALPSLAEDLLPDPDLVDSWHRPTDSVDSVHDVNFPGYEWGCYISASGIASAKNFYWTNHQNHDVGFASKLCYSGIAVYQMFAPGYGPNDWLDPFTDPITWSSNMYRDESMIYFRLNFTPQVTSNIYIFVSGYSEYQLNKAYYKIQRASSYSSEIELQYADYQWAQNNAWFDDDWCRAFDQDGKQIPSSNNNFPVWNGASTTWVIKFTSISSDVDRLWVYFPDMWRGQENYDLLEELGDIPNWIPPRLIGLFTQFFINCPFLSYCLTIMALGVTCSIIIKFAG